MFEPTETVHFLTITHKAMVHANNGETKFFHVMYNYLERSWSVKIDFYKEAVFTSFNKDDCITEAKRLAQESSVPKRKVMVRGKNGAVIEEMEIIG